MRARRAERGHPRFRETPSVEGRDEAQPHGRSRGARAVSARSLQGVNLGERTRGLAAEERRGVCPWRAGGRKAPRGVSMARSKGLRQRCSKVRPPECGPWGCDDGPELSPPSRRASPSGPRALAPPPRGLRARPRRAGRVQVARTTSATDDRGVVVTGSRRPAKESCKVRKVCPFPRKVCPWCSPECGPWGCDDGPELALSPPSRRANPSGPDDQRDGRPPRRRDRISSAFNRVL